MLHLFVGSVFVSHGEACHAISVNNEMVDVQEINELRLTQEEADTKMCLHAQYISESCSNSIVIETKSPDTDIFIIGFDSI